MIDDIFSLSTQFNALNRQLVCPPISASTASLTIKITRHARMQNHTCNFSRKVPHPHFISCRRLVTSCLSGWVPSFLPGGRKTSCCCSVRDKSNVLKKKISSKALRKFLLAHYEIGQVYVSTRWLERLDLRRLFRNLLQCPAKVVHRPFCRLCHKSACHNVCRQHLHTRIPCA